MTNKHTNLYVDVSNLAWKSRYMNKLHETKKEPFVPQLIFLTFMNEMLASFKKYKADGVLCAFEGKGNWRKSFYADYKNKEKDDIYAEDVKEAIGMIMDFLTAHSSIKCVSVPKSEADDVIAVACQNKGDYPTVIISSDKDFVQLLKWGDTRLYSPQQDKERTSEDPDYDLFMKCIRGDTSDNIFSAFPRVRATKLEEAFYGDSMSMLNLLETELKDGEKVVDKYQFNKKLIDLTQQPEKLREQILAELQTPTTGKYNQGAVMKFAKEHKIEMMIKDTLSGKYTAMFNSTFKL